MSILVEVTDLRTHFYLEEGVVRAVDGVSFTIEREKTLGVVGESGCGKSVTAQSILRIVPRPGRIVTGRIDLYPDGSDQHGKPLDLAQVDPTGPLVRSIRGKDIAMIFQEPMTAFSPLHTIGNQIVEAILLHQSVGKLEARELAAESLARVGIPDATRRVDAYPHELSGGMRQRAMIAMALSCNPRLLIADEPTTAIDVTIQAQILDLMERLQADLGMAIMFITHDLGVIAEMADDVIIMYWGKVVEQSDADRVFNDAKHPYTRALLRSIPQVGEKSGERLASIKGVVPHPFSTIPGCPYYPRCSEARPGVCDVGIPPALREVEAGHRVACVLYHDERSE